MYGNVTNQTRVSFLTSEFALLQIDAARGEGEYINTFAELSGCPADSYRKVGSVMKKEFDSIFGSVSKDPVPVLRRIDSALRTEAGLQISCLALDQG
jgi:hypothetical protein